MSEEPSWVRIIPLGGLGEIGMNHLVVETAEDLVIIDAGLMFPEEEMLGIDLVIPDFTYLRERQGKIRGIILTHGHEDHTGALPFLLQSVRAPVYGTPLSLGLAAEKLREFGVKAETHAIRTGDTLVLGGVTVECIRVCHSIPDGIALAMVTPAGLVVHSGDFKLDSTPVDDEPTDERRFSELGGRGVLLLLSDSTNALRPGVTPSERSVGAALQTIFTQARRRVIVACFASHIHRIQQILDVAHALGKRVAIHGKSVVASARIAADLGYLHIPEGTLVRLDELTRCAPEATVIVTTGSQGEPLSALTRMAVGEHKQIEICPGDTVIFSARVIPGNERAITRTINQLFRRGAEVITEEVAPVHVSGHPSQEELKRMLCLTRPRFFLPIHGEYRHLHAHADLAVAVGVPAERVFVAEDGDVLEFTPEKGEKVDRVPAGRVFVDGKGIGDVGELVLRDRQRLAEDGVVVVVLGVERGSGRVVAGPEILSRGFVYVREAEELLRAAKEIVMSTVEACTTEERGDGGLVQERLRAALRKFIQKGYDRRPMIMPVILEV
ncbi:MAG: ribonuclease J [Candidatus Methylomirabilales bacterium]